jgi:hypothetical protein
MAGKKQRGARRLDGHWLDDPRLPDEDTSHDRIYGSARPKSPPPHFAPIVASCVVKRRGKAAVKLEVATNRTRTKHWFTVLLAEKYKKDPNDPMAHLRRPDAHGYVYSMMFDYDSTTSKKKAQDWIDAVNGACGRKR